MTIALLCPTAGRPKLFKRMVDSVRHTGGEDVHIYSYMSPEDKALYPQCGDRRWSGPDYPTVHKWNLLADEARKNNHKLFILGADDTIFATPRWSEALLDHYDNLENKIHVYALQDSRDINGHPHPIVSREWIDAMGSFLPPYYFHWYVDTWTVAIAKANNCFTHLRDYELIHDKPSDNGMGDDTHNKIRLNGWQERDAYVNQHCQHILASEKLRLAHIIQEQRLEKVRAVG